MTRRGGRASHESYYDLVGSIAKWRNDDIRAAQKDCTGKLVAQILFTFAFSSVLLHFAVDIEKNTADTVKSECSIPYFLDW